MHRRSQSDNPQTFLSGPQPILAFLKKPVKLKNKTALKGNSQGQSTGLDPLLLAGLCTPEPEHGASVGV